MSCCNSGPRIDITQDDMPSAWYDALRFLAQQVVETGALPRMPAGTDPSVWNEAVKPLRTIEGAAWATLLLIMKNGEPRDCEAMVSEDGDAFVVTVDDGQYEVALADVPQVIFDLVSRKDTIEALSGIPSLGVASSAGRVAILRAAKTPGVQDDGQDELVAFYRRALLSMRMTARLATLLAKERGLPWEAHPNRMRLPSGLMVGLVVQAGCDVLIVPREQAPQFVALLCESNADTFEYQQWRVDA